MAAQNLEVPMCETCHHRHWANQKCPQCGHIGKSKAHRRYEEQCWSQPADDSFVSLRVVRFPSSSPTHPIPAGSAGHTNGSSGGGGSGSGSGIAVGVSAATRQKVRFGRSPNSEEGQCEFAFCTSQVNLPKSACGDWRLACLLRQSIFREHARQRQQSFALDRDAYHCLLFVGDVPVCYSRWFVEQQQHQHQRQQQGNGDEDEVDPESIFGSSALGSVSGGKVREGGADHAGHNTPEVEVVEEYEVKGDGRRRRRGQRIVKQRTGSGAESPPHKQMFPDRPPPPQIGRGFASGEEAGTYQMVVDMIGTVRPYRRAGYATRMMQCMLQVGIPHCHGLPTRGCVSWRSVNNIDPKNLCCTLCEPE